MKRKINTACYITMGMLGIYISVYQSIINAISQSYTINNTVSGLIISLHFIGSLVAPIVFGEISDRVGKRSIIVISFIIFITGLLMVYTFSSLSLIATGIFIIGCGFAVIEGTLSGLLSDENTNEKSKVINFSQMFLSIGAVTGPMVALLLMTLSGSWKSVFLMMIVLFGIILAYFSKLQIKMGSLVYPKNNSGLISLKLFKEKLFICLCLSIFVYVGIEEGVAFWLGTYFKATFSAGQMGTYALSAYWASMIVGRYVASKFRNMYDLFLIGGLSTSLVFICLALIWESNIVNLICFFYVGFGFSAVWPIIISITADSYPKYTGTAIGIMMTSGAGGGITVPFLIGTVASFQSIWTTFWVIPILIIFLLIILSFIKKWRYFRYEHT